MGSERDVGDNDCQLPQGEPGGTGPLVDRLCDEFESHWRSDNPPQIEEYLSRVPSSNRRELFSQLIGIELHWRRQRDGEPDAEEYHRRFPQDADLLDREIHASDDSTAHPDDERGDTFSVGGTITMPSGTDVPGRFGNYDLLAEIGCGGMGVVYRARQRTADRIVALKLIRRDRLVALPRDTQTGLIQRFQQEGQTAAQLDHDHIVTVYEVGEVDGQPFFSMRLVDGLSVADVLRDGPLDNRRAATYMESVSRAVHEAHVHGILHRDLKPQNVLIDEKSDRALVADFGLAKLTEVAEEMTRAGEVMGTPQFMSPEQAQDASSVTARSDVYSLGATLYHMLTARPPFQAATGMETLRQVIDQEPVPPRQLNRSIDLDLETICLKCLEKDPSRRYVSAELLADDLSHYLNHQPIKARRTGVLGRAWRLCRRNPRTAVAATLAVAFLIVALVATTVGYVETTAALESAEAAREQDKETARLARDAIDRFFTRVSEYELLDQPGMQPLRQDLLEDAIDYYRQFLARRGSDPLIRDELAMTHFRVGRITELVESPEKALPSYERARVVQHQLAAERPADLARLKALSDTENRIGRALHQMQILDEALDAYAEAAAIRERLAKAAPDNNEYQRALANVQMNIGLVERDRDDLKEARRKMDQAQAIRRRLLATRQTDYELRRDFARGHFNLAIVAIYDEDYAAADESFKEATAVFEDLAESSSNRLANTYRLATCYRLWADLKSEQGNPSAAIELYDKSRKGMELLAVANPDVAEYRFTLAGLYMNLGLLHSERKEWGAALAPLEKAHTHLAALLMEQPDVPDYRLDLALTLREMGVSHTAAGDGQTGLRELQAARTHLEKLCNDCPDDPYVRSVLAETIELIPPEDASSQRKTAPP